MESLGSRNRPTYAISLLSPFAELLEEYDDMPDLVAAFGAVDDRVLVEVAHRGLEMSIAHTGDPDLGLRAARRLVIGDVGTVDYVVGSAPTVRQALDSAARYIRLINDVLEVRLVLDGQSARVCLDNSVSMPRAAVDFEVGGFFRNHIREWLMDSLSEVAVCFLHPAPDGVAEYHRTFDPATVRFGAPFLGFEFDRRLLDASLKSADPNLHAVLVPYAEQTMGQLAPTKSVSADVLRLIHEMLDLGGPDIGDVSSKLGMSMRTLARRLEREGTTFRNLVDQARRQLALDFVGRLDADFSSIASRLGFSHGAAFHRAFRRWTGQTPLAYRRAHGR